MDDLSRTRGDSPEGGPRLERRDGDGSYGGLSQPDHIKDRELTSYHNDVSQEFNINLSIEVRYVAR